MDITSLEGIANIASIVAIIFLALMTWLSESCRNAMDRIFIITIYSGTMAIVYILKFWDNVVNVVRIIGNIIIVIIAFVAASTIVHLFLLHVGIRVYFLSEMFNIVRMLFMNHIAAAAFGVLVGSMVYISHMLNLEINHRKYVDALQERTEKKYEERKKREEAERLRRFVTSSDHDRLFK